MAHAIWSGVVKFGLVTVPVKMHTAVRSEDLSFKMLHGKDNGKIRFERVCEPCGHAVPFDEIVKGFEYEAGEYVIVTEDDLKAVNPEVTGAIEILEFVAADLVNPMLFEKPYYLEPTKQGRHAYALLREALRETGRLAVARVVIRSKEHLAAVRVVNDALVVQLLAWAGEVADAADLKLIPTGDEEALPENERAMARMLLDQMTTDEFSHAKFANVYHEELVTMLEAKAAGIAPTPQAPVKREKVVNIMDMLAASIEAKKVA